MDNRRYFSGAITIAIALLALNLLQGQGAGPGLALAQPEITPAEPEGLVSAAEQRKQLLLELKAVGAKVDKLQKAVDAGIKVKVISMPETKKDAP